VPATISIRPQAAWLALFALGALTQSAPAANLLAHWTFDQATAPNFADTGPNALEMTADAGATPVQMGAGRSGTAVGLNWQANPGIATRLYATGAPLQTDSFGFSFWLNPTCLNAYDNLLLKEMAYTNTDAYLRVAWQFQVQAETSGSAPLELIVRGDQRTNGNFFGNVLSVTNVTLRTDTTSWIHVAGGYDAATGKLSLFFNGAGRTNTGAAGAHCSDGSPLSLGSARNGPDFIAFAAAALIDDLQIYDAPLSATEVRYLLANPGQTLSTNAAFTITQISLNPTNAALQLQYTFYNGWKYAVDLSTNLQQWTQAADFEGTCECNTTVLSTNLLNQVLGNGSHPRVFARIRRTALPINGN